MCQQTANKITRKNEKEKMENFDKSAVPEIIHGSCGNKWFLRIVQYMSQSIHPYMEVCYVHTHSLLTHSRL